MLPDSFLEELVADIQTPASVAIGLTGGHARGDASPYSDIDVLHFLPDPPPEPHYRLLVRADWLISLTQTSIKAKYDDLAQPESAIWAVPGLRQMRILWDPDGMLAALQQAARDFDWSPLQAAAQAYASEQIMGYAEEAHKVMRGLSESDAGLQAYGVLGLALGLTTAVAVHKGLLLTSENSYLQQVSLAVGGEWAQQQRIALGLTVASPAMRAQAALRLYNATAALFDAIIQPDHRPVVDLTCGRIQDFVA